MAGYVECTKTYTINFVYEHTAVVARLNYIYLRRLQLQGHGFNGVCLSVCLFIYTISEKPPHLYDHQTI